MKNKIIVGGIALLIVAGIIISVSNGKKADEQAVSTDDPIDIAIDFYDEWLDAVVATGTDPYQAGLADKPILSQALRTQLTSTQGAEGVDPVLCQSVPPVKTGSRTLYEQEDMVQILILSRKPAQAGQATLTLRSANGGWYIDDIQCSQGESAPEREFDFTSEGLMLENYKLSDVQVRWHLGYTQDDAWVKTVPLFFNADSMCVNSAGEEAVCDIDQFTDTQKVLMQGSMTEAGLTVQRVTEL